MRWFRISSDLKLARFPKLHGPYPSRFYFASLSDSGRKVSLPCETPGRSRRLPFDHLAGFCDLDELLFDLIHAFTRTKRCGQMTEQGFIKIGMRNQV
jgi:hypothetical protein